MSSPCSHVALQVKQHCSPRNESVFQGNVHTVQASQKQNWTAMQQHRSINVVFLNDWLRTVAGAPSPFSSTDDMTCELFHPQRTICRPVDPGTPNLSKLFFFSLSCFCKKTVHWSVSMWTVSLRQQDFLSGVFLKLASCCILTAFRGRWEWTGLSTVSHNTQTAAESFTFTTVSVVWQLSCCYLPARHYSIDKMSSNDGWNVREIGIDEERNKPRQETKGEVIDAGWVEVLFHQNIGLYLLSIKS